ncbi:PID-CTERM protein-sorting domain-containing protein [Lutibacter sp. HS1-25]|uniref:PID-CTERM protein-sorting domain-containing protein n=1 Tax=Lutibacter sp. HS1-25 TaxID=2485000 RepID=UPI0010118291|nr:hypothetical protein [Lutibacter sp. HS1-25]
MSKKINKILLCTLLVLNSFVGYSQVIPKPGDKSGPVPPPPPGLPIDGGLGFLIISGIAYGVFELKRKK